jgi:hypothetical protein
MRQQQARLSNDKTGFLVETQGYLSGRRQFDAVFFCALLFGKIGFIFELVLTKISLIG